jgi:hypothetical protein
METPTPSALRNLTILTKNREVFQNAFKPTSTYLTGDSVARTVLACLAVFSARPETWEYLVSLASFAQARSIERGDQEVAELLRRSQLEFPAIRPHIKQIASLPMDDVLAGGDVIYELISPKIVASLIRSIFELPDCLEKCGLDPECLKLCIQQAAANISD